MTTRAKWSIGWDHVVWGGVYYVYWFNWLHRSTRHLGPYMLYYDGPHWSFGFWWFNVSWCLPCNKWDPARSRFPWLRNWK